MKTEFNPLRSDTVSCKAVQSDLAAAGLNLFAVLDSECAQGIYPVAGATLLLIGNTGQDLWSQVPSEYFSRRHPLDEYSASTASTVVSKHFPDLKVELLFPLVAIGSDAGARSQAPVPLQRLGELAGWHSPSPLGTGINLAQGLWFAYRAVISLGLKVPPDPRPKTAESPCLSCVSQACVKSCPTAALQLGRSPDMQACARYRLLPNSPCKLTCIARDACPIARGQRYPDAQVAHHYRHGLRSLEEWLKRGS